MVREITELEVGQLSGTHTSGERAPERRTAQRNGYRGRRWSPWAGRSSCRYRDCGRGGIRSRFWTRAPAG